MHTLLKSPIERVLSSSGIGRVAHRRINGKRLILAYHGVTPNGAEPQGEQALFITQRDFAAHLDLLAELADVAPLDCIDAEGDGRPRVAITIDDAYRGAVCEGVSELVARRLPATIFVAPGRLNGHVFWWDALARRGQLDPRVRAHALDQLGGQDEQVRAWAVASGLSCTTSIDAHIRAATRDELDAAVSCNGITVASHSWSHANLASLSSNDLNLELSRSQAWLRGQYRDKAISWLAYPYGLDSPSAHRAAADASYVGALRISGGWHSPPETPRFARPRYTVPARLTVHGLKARLLGGIAAL